MTKSELESGSILKTRKRGGITMTKSELESGDVVKTRDGGRYLLIDYVGYSFPSIS